jgi:hypothetical protein
MEVLPRTIAKLRHWHLFVLMLVPMLMAGLYFRPAIETPTNQFVIADQFTTMMLVSWPGYVVWYGWIWSTGLVGNSALSESLRKSDRLAWFSSPVALAYGSIAIWAFPTVMFDPGPGAAKSIMVVAHLIASILTIYALFFCSTRRSIARPRIQANHRESILVLSRNNVFSDRSLVYSASAELSRSDFDAWKAVT